LYKLHTLLSNQLIFFFKCQVSIEVHHQFSEGLYIVSLFEVATIIVQTAEVGLLFKPKVTNKSTRKQINNPK